MAAEIARVVALGASNLARAFTAFVAVARNEWGPQIQVLAALGHGRSYGGRSRVGFRTLPGILDSGLWRSLESLPPVPTRALVSDVGNDILYGSPADRILAWIEETVVRLRRYTQDIVITNLPLATISRLSPGKFLLFRTILFPSSRLSFRHVLETARRVDEGISSLANARGSRLARLDTAWYGLDPIHIRRALWRSAWEEILDTRSGNAAGSSLAEGLKLHLMPPERRWLFGVEQFTPQSGIMLPSGGRVWLY